MENKTLKKRGFGPALKNFCKKKPLGAAGIAFLLFLLIISVFADALAPVKMEAKTPPMLPMFARMMIRQQMM